MLGNRVKMTLTIGIPEIEFTDDVRLQTRELVLQLVQGALHTHGHALQGGGNANAAIDRVTVESVTPFESGLSSRRRLLAEHITVVLLINPENPALVDEIAAALNTTTVLDILQDSPTLYTVFIEDGGGVTVTSVLIIWVTADEGQVILFVVLGICGAVVVVLGVIIAVVVVAAMRKGTDGGGNAVDATALVDAAKEPDAAAAAPTAVLKAKTLSVTQQLSSLLPAPVQLPAKQQPPPLSATEFAAGLIGTATTRREYMACAADDPVKHTRIFEDLRSSKKNDGDAAHAVGTQAPQNEIVCNNTTAAGLTNRSQRVLSYRISDIEPLNATDFAEATTGLLLSPSSGGNASSCGDISDSDGYSSADSLLFPSAL